MTERPKGIVGEERGKTKVAAAIPTSEASTREWRESSSSAWQVGQLMSLERVSTSQEDSFTKHSGQPRMGWFFLSLILGQFYPFWSG